MLALGRAAPWTVWWERHQMYGLLVLSTFVAGSLLGALALNALDPTQRLALLTLVKRFVNVVIGQSVASPTIFGTALETNLKVLGLIYILGVSVAGLPLVLLAVFFRGFVLGFAIGFFLGTLHGLGLGIALIAVVVPNLALVPAWLAAGAGGVAFSWQLMSRAARLGPYRLPEAFAQYTVVALAGTLAIALGSLLQAFFAPMLLHWLGPWGI